jgi:threonine/homoserine/homoserine lactone efflux protein
MLALLDALNDIPLLLPILELIGLAYTTWFVYRYLISAVSRQELSEEIKSLKDYVLGREN